jgi:hypothetical protein
MPGQVKWTLILGSFTSLMVRLDAPGGRHGAADIAPVVGCRLMASTKRC